MGKCYLYRAQERLMRMCCTLHRKSLSAGLAGSLWTTRYYWRRATADNATLPVVDVVGVVVVGGVGWRVP